MSAARSIAAALLGSAVLHAGAVTPVDDFERAFPARGEPASLHYEVQYEDARGTHRLSVWREGSTQLRRRTDDVLDLLVERDTDDELRMNVIDHRRHIVTAVSRTALYRVGHGLDWYGLAHGLARPSTAFAVRRLAHAPKLATAAAPSAACRWFELAEGEHRSAVCWSAALHLPVLIAAQPAGSIVWRVTASHAGPIDPASLVVPAAGYVRVNADEDIQAD